MRKKTKRKHWELVDPISYAIAGASITPRSALDQLRTIEYSALDAMVRGNGTVNDWQILCNLMNVAETMALNGIGPEVLPICAEVQNSLISAAKRYESTKKMGLDGSGISNLKELIAYADLQQSSVSRSEFERLIVKTKAHVLNKTKEVVEI